MSAYVGGTVGAYQVGVLGNGFPRYEFRAPTQDELEELRERTTKEREQCEQREREREENIRKNQQEHLAWLEERKVNSPVEDMSGEFNGDDRRMDVWPSDDTDYPRVQFAIGKCDFCKGEAAVLEIDNSYGEYSCREACLACLGKMFDAFANHLGGAA